MKSTLDDIDNELLGMLLPVLESKLAEAERRRDEAQSEVDYALAKIARVRQKMNAAEMFLELPATTLSGRIKKGESERLISNFLKNRNGSGATVKEVTKATSTTYGTARRILRLFVETGKAVEKSGSFRWNNNLSVPKPTGAGAPAKGDA
jgi:hypothetical protein